MSAVRYGLYVRTAAGGDAAADAQLSTLRGAIAQRGAVAVVVERDVNVSGGGRPGAGPAALLRAAAAGRVDAVAVTSLDRFARSPRTLDEILASLHRAGVSVLVPEVVR